eukprot:scaffold36328_cov142-Isochrysis_galbana.AAC.2
MSASSVYVSRPLASVSRCVKMASGQRHAAPREDLNKVLSADHARAIRVKHLECCVNLVVLGPDRTGPAMERHRARRRDISPAHRTLRCNGCHKYVFLK